MANEQARMFLLWTFLTGLQYVACASARSQYGIIMDAGSSGTRARIYNFVDEDGSLDPSEVNQVKAEPRKEKPGLASFAGHPEDIEAYLQPLLDAAQKAIPADQHHATPIFLFATAGMRLLREADQKIVLDEVDKIFSDKEKCPFEYKSNGARVITGQWEGIYAWITVNFLEGTFSSNKKIKSYGILDLGGASHQNAFKDKIERPEHVDIEVKGNTYTVFSRSYLGYGQDQARKAFQNVLVKLSSCSDSEECSIENPCQFDGYEEVIDIDGVEYNFVGKTDIQKCRSIIKHSFFCKEASRNCPFHDQPRLPGRFIGVSALFYVLNGIGLLDGGNVVTPRSVGPAADSFCHLDYEDVNEDPYATANCFGANYIFELLKDGYRLPARKEITVEISKNGFDLGWALGALLYEAKLLWG